MGSVVSSQKNCLPDWWFVSYVLVLSLLVVVVAVLVSNGATAAAAVTAATALSRVAISVVRRLRIAARHATA